MTTLERTAYLGVAPARRTRHHAPAGVRGRCERRRGRSVRSIQDHFVPTTGLTQGMLRQIKRARAAADLLSLGVPIVDAVHEQACYDQAHMTRS